MTKMPNNVHVQSEIKPGHSLFYSFFPWLVQAYSSTAAVAATSFPPLTNPTFLKLRVAMILESSEFFIFLNVFSLHYEFLEYYVTNCTFYHIVLISLAVKEYNLYSIASLSFPPKYTCK